MKDYDVLTNNGIAELVGQGIFIATPQDALDIIMEAVYAESRKIVLHKEHVVPDFFDLKSGLAGEVLQKVINYQVQIAVVGDFQNIQSDSFQAFVRECNRGKDMYFVRSLEDAMHIFK